VEAFTPARNGRTVLVSCAIRRARSDAPYPCIEMTPVRTTFTSSQTSPRTVNHGTALGLAGGIWHARVAVRSLGCGRV